MQLQNPLPPFFFSKFYFLIAFFFFFWQLEGNGCTLVNWGSFQEKKFQLILIHKFCRSSFPEQARVKGRKREKNAPRIGNEMKSSSFRLFLFFPSDPHPTLSNSASEGSRSCKDGLHMWDRRRFTWTSCGQGVVEQGISDLSQTIHI